MSNIWLLFIILAIAGCQMCDHNSTNDIVDIEPKTIDELTREEKKELFNLLEKYMEEVKTLDSSFGFSKKKMQYYESLKTTNQDTPPILGGGIIFLINEFNQILRNALTQIRPNYESCIYNDNENGCSIYLVDQEEISRIEFTGPLSSNLSAFFEPPRMAIAKNGIDILNSGRQVCAPSYIH
ncbi:MAG: hypothetical protein HY762_05185 [Planctomycetes bacterium]|nr:hypothetical protein [Planctomycetota bacterium]